MPGQKEPCYFHVTCHDEATYTHTLTHGTTYCLPRWIHTVFDEEAKSYNALLFCNIDINGTGSVELASFMIVK